MRRKSFDLLLAIVVAILSCVLAFTGVGSVVVRLIFALPLVFFMPGYAVVEAVFPAHVLGAPERLLFSLGLSLIGGVFGGLVLNTTPWGLQAGSWAALLSAITLGASIVAWLRRRKTTTIVVKRRLGLDGRQTFLLGLASVGVIGALAIASIGAAQPRNTGFTQLWILPTEGIDSETVQLGVKNMETETMNYRLQLTMDERPVKDWTPITLQPGETWETTFTLPSGRVKAKTVEALLYRLDDPKTVYRKVVLWR